MAPAQTRFHPACLIAPLWLALAPLTASAQPQPAPPIPPEDVTVLAEFRITAERDNGYLANNAISGTKTNTPLRDLPMSISVLTEEMLNDIAVLQPSEALNYSASVSMPSAQTQVQNQGSEFGFGGQVNVRGSGTFFAMRDGFRVYGQPAGAFTERIEVVKGPASVLYGITKPGGIVNYITKRPDFGRNQARASVTFGSYSSTSGRLDVNHGRLLDNKLSIRVLGSYTDLGSWFTVGRSYERAVAGMVSVRPFGGTEITLRHEHFEQEFLAPNTNFLLRPVSGFIGSSVPFFVYPTSADDPVRLLSPQLPPGFTPRLSVRGAGNVAYRPSRVTIGELTQRVTDSLVLNFQYSFTSAENDRRVFLLTPQFTGPLVDTNAGNPVPPPPRLRWQYGTLNETNDYHNYALTAIHRRAFRLPWVGTVEGKAVVGVSRLQEKYEQIRFRQYRPGTQTQISYYTPLRPDADFSAPPAFPAPIGVVQRDLSSAPTEDNDFDQAFASYSASMLEDRFILNAGVTRALFEQVRVNRNFAGDPTAVSSTASQNSPLLGAIVRPLRWASLYIQESRSFNPNTSARDGFNNPLPPEIGEGFEVGVKLDPMEGRLSATLGVFRIKERNRVVSDPNAPNLNSFYLDANGEPRPISGPNDPRYDPFLPGQNRGASTAVGQAIQEGFDLDLVYSPTRAFQLVGSYAYLDMFSSRDTNTSLVSRTGRPLPGLYPHRAALLGKYRFLRGPLRNFDVVLGVNWRDRIYRDTINADGAPSTAISAPVDRYGPDAWDGDLKVGYRHRILGRNVSFQFNARNLFGRDMALGWKPDAGKPFSDEQYIVEVPTSYTFTTSVAF